MVLVVLLTLLKWNICVFDKLMEILEISYFVSKLGMS